MNVGLTGTVWQEIVETNNEYANTGAECSAPVLYGDICMKKRFIILLVLYVVLFSGCQKKDEQPKKEIITSDTEEKTEYVTEEKTKEITEEPTQEEGEKHIDKFTIYSEYNVTEAKQYDKIDYLIFDRAHIKDYSFMKDIEVKKLQVLTSNYPVDLGCVNTEYIEAIFIRDAEIKNANTLKDAPNFTNLIIKNSNNMEVDLSFLNLCKNIGYIELYNCCVKDLTFAENLTELTKILVENSQISDLSPLASCINLEDIEITESRVRDVSALSGLLKLNRLDLKDNYITDISPLKTCLENNLQYVYLEENFITEADVFEYAKDAEGINLSKNYLTKIPRGVLVDGVISDLCSNNIAQISPEEFELLDEKNVIINLFDNPFDSETMEKLVMTGGVYLTTYDDIHIQEEEAIEFNNKMQLILNECNIGDDKEKVFRTLYYVANNCTPDYAEASEHRNNAYGALFDSAMCMGMTDITDSILRHMGIMTKQYHGDTDDLYDNVRHVWNVVYTDGEWYHCDATYSVAYKDANDIPKLVLLSDDEIEKYGHILDAQNIEPCDIALDEIERKNIANKIKR